MPDDRLLSIAEVAAELEVALPTVYKWIHLGRVASESNPLSGRYAIRQSEVDRVRPYVRRRK
jgi:excisionase family DNA binding protein